MKIAIIGTGHMGSALAHRFTDLGHDVAVANSRGPQTLTDLATQTGAHPAGIDDVARGAEIVVVAMPERRVPELPATVLDEASPDVIVIDLGNYYPQQRDGRIDEIEQGTTESRWVERQIGHPVVKVFNTIPAAHLRGSGRSAGDPRRLALPVSADDAKAKQVVSRLVDDLGFDPVDDGGLDDSWRQQPGQPVYGEVGDADHVRAALLAATERRPATFSAS